MGYTIIGSIKPHGNKVYLIKDSQGKHWAGKVVIENCFSDFNTRAMLATHLSQKVDAGLPEAHLVKRTNISGWEKFPLADRLMDDYVFLTPHREYTACEYLKSGKIEDIVNLDQMVENITFNLWLGNYDRKDDDYIVSADRRAYAIDYHMYGIGITDDPTHCVGACWGRFSLDEPADTGWCAPPYLIDSYLRAGKDKRPMFNMLDRIQALPKEAIEKQFQGIELMSQKPETTNITSQFREFLLNRRAGIEHALNNWVDSDFPRR